MIKRVLLTLLIAGTCQFMEKANAQGPIVNSSGQTQQNSNLSKGSTRKSFKVLLRDIEARFGVQFLYKTNDIPDQIISLDTHSGTLEEVLESVLFSTGLTYKKVYNTYILSKKEISSKLTEWSIAPVNSIPSDKLAMVGAFQEIIVSGKVTGENGQDFSGVTVLVKGTDESTTTDDKGIYKISVPDDKAVLVFSYIGFQEIAVGDRTTLDVSLKNESKVLCEVLIAGYGETRKSDVVVGYGTVKKSDLTGAVAKVGEANINATPIPSLERSMQGRAAGVQVVTNSAAPGGNSTIRIRGSGSVNASNDPLYVIDGFPTTDLNSINTNDIESVEVLKDASATAIYGSRGSNGVVLVTTKRGKAGKTVISYDTYYGLQSVRRKIPLLDAHQFADFVNEARVNGGGRPYFDGSTADQPLASSFGKGTDWQSQIFRTAPIQNHQLAASGGSEKSRYAVSFGSYNQQGIILNTNFKRYTLRTNLDNNLTSKLKLGLTIQGAYTKGNYGKTDVDGNNGGGVTSSALSYAPIFPVYNANGSYYKNTGALNGYGVDNPLAVANEITNLRTTLRLLANSYLDYTIIEGLVFRTSFGADLQGTKSNSYATRLSLAGSTLGGTASVGTGQSVGWLNENTLNYTRQLAPKHNLNVLLGQTTQALATETVVANANTFTNDFALYNNLSTGSSLVAPTSGASDWRLISYLARINYGFDDRFLLTLTGRSDGSSRFGPNQKFGFFPSGALAWKMENETWMKSLPAISDAKLRVSYGLSGNQEIGNYSYLSNILSTPYILGEALNSGSYTGSIANPNLRWERNAQFDVGIDLGLFNNRIQFTADYYIKNTVDLLFNVGVPTSSGYSTMLRNIGSVQNKGLELSLNTINIEKGDFRWSSEFNITFNENKIQTLDGRQEFTTGTDAVIFATNVNPILLKVGSSLGNFYGLVMDGIFQNQTDVGASAQKTAKPGDIRYKDLNDDGIINDKDRDIIGNANPKFFGGFNNMFSFRGFELNIFVQGSYGNNILNYGTFDLLNLTGGNNQSARVLDRWTPTNPSNTIPRANSSGGARVLSSFHVEDGSYLRFKNISLGYNLPKAMLSRCSISSAKIYVTVQNWITLTNYTGYDPEVNRYGSSSLSQGIDYGGYPSAKTILVGLNLKF